MKKATENNKLNLSKFELTWQSIWEKRGIYQPSIKSAKKPFYNLMMFPYPSAEGLHVGNMYAFTGADIYGRFMRMKGMDVFEPIGLDGFGIHSENYAIKVGRHPVDQAKISEKHFYNQLSAIGNSFAWRNTLETYNPDYYKWTQWIFIKMFKAGLAVRRKSSVNFCPSCKTVLADEQVINGICERCSTKVEKKDLAQWFFKITDYAQRLLDGLTKIDWVKKVKIAQKNWIGKKEGININYKVVDNYGTMLNLVLDQVDGSNVSKPAIITCFTTRPDTNFGATFVVLAPEHPFVTELLKTPQTVAGRSKPEAMTSVRWRNQIAKVITNSKKKEIKGYVEKAKKKSEIERIAEGREKTGVFTGLYCINNLTGYKMPVYISDFVIMDVGTGAVVGVPGHDKRDFEFAKKFDLEVVRVVVGSDGDKSPITRIEQVQEEEGTIINSQFLDGLDIHEATGKIMDYMEKERMGKRVISYRLRDWCISRQRYWGPPIPMVFCQSCADENKSWFTTEEAEKYRNRIIEHNARDKFKKQNSNQRNSFEARNWKLENTTSMAGWYPVQEDELPVKLPFIEDYRPKGTGESPLASSEEFINVKCPGCRKTAKRETDVSDTFLDSAWYFLRYPSVNQNSEFRNQKSKNRPLITDNRQLPWDEQVTKKWLPVNMYIGGAEHSVLHLLYARFLTYALHDMGYLHFEEPFSRFYAHGLIIAEGVKMSKSKGNVIVPDKYINKYGADTLRTYLMFLGPFDQGGDFRDTGIAGMYRFLGRVWRLVDDFKDQKERVGNTSDGTRLSVNKDSQAQEGVDSCEVDRSERTLLRFMHKAIKEVTEDIESLRYNTAIAHIMKYVNRLTENRQLITDDHVKSLLLMLAPFAPHMTEELYQRFSGQWSVVSGQKRKNLSKKPTTANRQTMIYKSIHLHPWPTYDSKYLEEEEVTIVVQVNGKLRDTIKMQSQRSKVKNNVETEAKESKKVQKYIKDKKIRRTIFVPGKLINFVI